MDTGHNVSKASQAEDQRYDTKSRTLDIQFAGIGDWTYPETQLAGCISLVQCPLPAMAPSNRSGLPGATCLSQPSVDNSGSLPVAIDQFLREAPREAGQVEVWLGQRRIS